VACGVCNASLTWPIEQIREATGRQNLRIGTLNVRLDEPYAVRHDFTLYGAREEIYFECCLLLIGRATVEALIARTSVNYWGDWYLEIMSAEHLRTAYGLQDEDSVRVQMRTEDNEELA